MKPARSIPTAVIRPSGPWQHHDLSAGGMRFHMVARGSGNGDRPALLLLHGFPEFWRAWIDVITVLEDELSVDQQIIAPDLRGCGGSDKQPSGYSLAALAADITALLNAFGVRKVLIVGHGLGAQIGWFLAASQPQRVHGLVTVASPHPLEVARWWGLVSPRVIAGQLLAHVPFIGTRLMENGHLLRRIFATWSAPSQRAQMLQRAEPYIQALNMPQAARGMLSHGARPYRFSAQTRRALRTAVTCPVTVVRGDDDPVFPARAFNRDQRHVANPADFQMATLADCGHFVPEEQAHALARIIVNQLER